VVTTDLYLVRHAEPSPSPGGEDAGSGLSEAGRQQAHRLGARLADVRFDALRHSPLRRATETAHILAGHLRPVPVSPSELLRDRTPIPSADESAGVPSRYLPFLEQVPAEERDPGARELAAAVSRLIATGTEDRVELLVTHNFVIGWFVRHVLEAPAWRWIGLNQRHCGLTVVRAHDDLPPALISFNDVGHL
jgi:serine/threonine-protein phosphatase PGAM5